MGVKYNEQLNMDANYVKTPAAYDSDLDEWLMLSKNYVYTGSLWVPQKANADGEVLTQLTGSTVAESYKIIANAVALTATTATYYKLTTNGGLTASEIRKYKNFKFTCYNTHDQDATITLLQEIPVAPMASVNYLYTEADNLNANNGRLILQSKAAGAGVSAAIKTIPCLEGVYSDLIIEVKFSIAPTTGSITIGVEMHG